MTINQTKKNNNMGNCKHGYISKDECKHVYFMGCFMRVIKNFVLSHLNNTNVSSIEMTAVITYVCTQYATVSITMLYFIDMRWHDLKFLWLFAHLAILSACTYHIMKKRFSGNGLITLLLYNFFVFLILWWFYSFSHQLVIIYYTCSTILNLIILSKYLNFYKMLVIANIGSILLCVDIFYRPEVKIQTNLWVTTIVLILYQSIFVIVYFQINDYRRLVQATQLKALIDPLTDAGNSRAFYKEVHLTLSTYNRTGEEFSLVFIDLNDFKLINDRYGHNIGDLVLKKFAHYIMGSIRKCDKLYRIGGDEFVILFPQTRLTKKMFIDMLKRVDDFKGIEAGLSISFCFGISIYDRRGLTIDELLHQADKRMYYAKEKNKQGIESVDNNGYFEMRAFMPDLAFNN